MARLLRSPPVLALAFMLFFQSGVEFTLGGYMTTYLTRVLSVDIAGASWMLAGSWAGLTAARFGLARVLLTADPHRLVLFCALGASTGSVVTAVAPKVRVAGLALVVVG